MSSKIENIWIEIYNILKEAQNNTLSYVKEIYQGTREDIVSFPVIILEPDIIREEEYSIPYRKKIIFTILISCWMEVVHKEKQIVGENEDKGILDFVSDVKNVISQYPNLKNKAIKFSFPTTDFVFETYPFRSATISMEIEQIVEGAQR